MIDKSGEKRSFEHLPIGLFSIVMGLSGFAISWRAVTLNWPLAGVISLFIAILASTIFVLLMFGYFYKFAMHPDAVKEELHHPVRQHFFPTASIGMMLLAVIWLPVTSYSMYLWGAGAMMQLALTLFVMSSWINKTHFEVPHVNPAWFIPVVGNIVAPIYGVKAGFLELSWFFFSIGITFWLILLTIVINRLIFHSALPQRLVPTLFILLAPPAVGFISYTELVGGIDTLAIVLFYVSLFLFLLLSMQCFKFFRTPFFVSSWAYSFPLAAFTTATFKMAAMVESTVIFLFGQALLVGLTLIVLGLLLATGRAIFRGVICVPE